ncbi:hypothetical protein GE061_007147 [Apolygus lucorum]|uniref:CCHC-type domain-containing protein n=1 Tax=Apolygus lucorum TaxID=248454 RepID=A0A8S9WQW4_APOLU|nr:hypothetical protein GE061_007147 [Apolygus lucorum]
MPRPRQQLPTARTVSTRQRAADESPSTLNDEPPVIESGETFTQMNCADETHGNVGHNFTMLLAENRRLIFENARLQEENRQFHERNSALCSRCNDALHHNSRLIAYEVSLLPYEGKTDWEEYLSHVDVVAQSNGWNEQRKAQKLASSLRGPALSILSTLSTNERTEWVPLTTALSKRFGQQNLGPKWQASLEARRQKTGESLSDLAADIEKMARLALPGWPESCKEQMGVRAFLKALADEDLKRVLAAAVPESVQDALTRAQLIEAAMNKEGCWECGQGGHARAKCPKRKQPQPQEN